MNALGHRVRMKAKGNKYKEPWILRDIVGWVNRKKNECSCYQGIKIFKYKNYGE